MKGKLIAIAACAALVACQKHQFDLGELISFVGAHAEDNRVNLDLIDSYLQQNPSATVREGLSRGDYEVVDTWTGEIVAEPTKKISDAAEQLRLSVANAVADGETQLMLRLTLPKTAHQFGIAVFLKTGRLPDDHIDCDEVANAQKPFSCVSSLADVPDWHVRIDASELPDSAMN